ncbi:unnamed protein product [Leptosia nina]|uniref:H/ACA ribonucleoprotein complex non-core subunit NAF1 n=1 Tax=Leptosia nina TaxID=320188 RepID=A0AAV1K0G8_9NEOP
MESNDEGNNQNVSLKLIAEYRSDSESECTPPLDNPGELDGDSDSVELSEMVLKNNIINACAHGPLSGGDADEDVTTHMIIDSSENGVSEYDVTMYRVDDEDSDDSETDSSEESSDNDVDSVKDVEEISSSDETTPNHPEKLAPPKVHGELSLDDLPPIEDLTISLPPQETTKIGKVFSIVDRLVVVQAFPETAAVDLDTVLFLNNGAKTLGKVFDVFGPVTEPHYCVRFNSAAHIVERGVEVGMEVFIAPRTPHTSYVFLTELIKAKGCDASWLNDLEPPASQVEFSDDEEERKAKKEKKQNRQEKHENAESGETSKNSRKMLEARRNRPTQSTSRFGTGPNRGYNADNRWPNPFMPFHEFHGRIPPPHPTAEMGPLTAPPALAFPMFVRPRMNFGRNPLLRPPNVPPFTQNRPVFGSNYCNMAGNQPRWSNRPPPPPGT